MQTFKAYRTFEQDKVVSSRFVDLSLDDLDAGDVVIRTKYSTINYKDALSYGGAGKIMSSCCERNGVISALSSCWWRSTSGSSDGCCRGWYATRRRSRT